MRVSELMVRDVTLVPSGDTVQNAARAIADIDSRFILVGVEERVVGVLTIRDILIRLVAAGLDPTATPVSQVMSSSLFTCTEEELQRVSPNAWPSTASSRCRYSTRADASWE